MKDMNEITIPKTTITSDQYAANARQLIASVLLQGARDYCKTKSETSRNTILKDLRSSRMDSISDGMSLIVAEQLELHPEEIAERLRQNCEDMV